MMDWQQKFEKDTGISKEAILTGANDMSPIDYHCELANYLIKKLEKVREAIEHNTGELATVVKEILGE